MLPLIGIVAIGLLALAGRFFFMSGFHSDRDVLPVMTQQRERPAQAAERAAALAPKGGNSSGNFPVPVPVPVPVPSPALSAARAVEAAPVLAVPDVLAVPVEEKKNSVSPARRTPPVSSVSPSSSASPTRPKPRPVLPPKPKTVAAPAPAGKKPAPSQKAQTSSGWTVQVGAFSTKSAAENVARQISKEGHSTLVVSEKTVHRVLVRAGSRNDASALADRMSRSGFPGAFVVSPGQ
jgi:cell division protein FtsN